MTAHDNGKGGTAVHCQLLGSRQQPVAGGKSIKLFRWTACVIGPRYAHQSIDAVDLLCQPTDCAVRSLGLMEGPRTKMATHQRDHFINEVLLIGQSFKKTSCRACPFRFMSP